MCSMSFRLHLPCMPRECTALREISAGPNLSGSAGSRCKGPCLKDSNSSDASDRRWARICQDGQAWPGGPSCLEQTKPHPTGHQPEHQSVPPISRHLAFTSCWPAGHSMDGRTLLATPATPQPARVEFCFYYVFGSGVRGWAKVWRPLSSREGSSLDKTIP